MSTEDKISLIEECMDIQGGTLSLNTVLTDFEEWDSLTALSLIALVSEKNHQTISGGEVREAKTVSDIVRLID